MKEMLVRYRLRRVPGAAEPKPRLETPRDVAILLASVLGPEINEVAGVLCLSVRSELLAYHELSRGTLDATLLSARDVFRTALLTHAASVIVAHNHPSGDPMPSGDDAAVTRRLVAAGDVIGIPLADHLIVTLQGAYFSFREAGLMQGS